MLERKACSRDSAEGYMVGEEAEEARARRWRLRKLAAVRCSGSKRRIARVASSADWVYISFWGLEAEGEGYGGEGPVWLVGEELATRVGEGEGKRLLWHA